MTRSKKKVGLVPKLILLAFVVYSAITLVSLQVKINDQRASMEDLSRQVTEENAKQTQLKQLLDAKVDDGYIITQAQQEGYAAPNERVFVDVSGE